MRFVYEYLQVHVHTGFRCRYVNVTHEQAREVVRMTEVEGKGIEEAGRRLALAVNAMEEASEIRRKVY